MKCEAKTRCGRRCSQEAILLGLCASHYTAYLAYGVVELYDNRVTEMENYENN